MPTSVIEDITTFADGFGRWRAHVEFSRALSENDPRAEFNLLHHLPAVRRHARTAIVRELALREQTTRESLADAEARIRASLPRLSIIKQDLDSVNLWHGVTLGE